MSTKFNELVTEALGVERELRLLTPDRPSLRCYVAECLERAGATYPEVEEIKARLEDPNFERHSGQGAYTRDVARFIANGRLPEPPLAARIGAMGFNMKDQAVFELGGHPEKLFLLLVIAAERAHQSNPKVFGTVEDLGAHKARGAELEGKRRELHERIARGWDTSDVVLGAITSDFAALVTWKVAPGVPVGKDGIAERLIDALLAREDEPAALAA